MKLPIDWLKELISFPWSDEELAARLIGLGIGVEDESHGVLTLEVAANRGDLLSVLGIAREVHALTGSPIRLSDVPPLPSGKPDLTVTLDHALVPRYTTAFITDVTLGPTNNRQVLERLESSGMRSVNNIVDLSNYLMLETGQPTHAFDYDKIKGKKMSVRLSKRQETLTTLDGVNRNLPEGVLVIADADRVIDLPGIMGGANSAIDDKTKHIVIQSAVFPYEIIRKASRQLQLATEASYRFERQVDEGGSLVVLQRLADLITKEAGGAVQGVVDRNETKPSSPISFDPVLFPRLIGYALAESEVKLILFRLGCRVSGAGENLTVTPPTWRHDLTVAADLVEEIARVSGYEKIRPTPLPKSRPLSSEDYLARESLKDWFVSHGLSEVMTYSLVSERDLTASGLNRSEAVAIANPLSTALGYFRPSLLPGLLAAAAKNPTVDPIKIFEIGRVATPKKERIQVGVLFAGRKAGTIKEVIKQLGLKSQAISPALKDQYKVRKQDVQVALADWEAVRGKVPVAKALARAVRFRVKALSKFPAVVRDVSFVVAESVGNVEIKTAISAVSDRIYLVELFDEFTSPKIGAGQKSLAFHVHYQDPDKTMTNEETGQIHKQIEALVRTKYHGEVR